MALVLRKLDLGAVWREMLAVALWPLVASLGTRYLGFVAMALRAQALFGPHIREAGKPVTHGRHLKALLLAFAGNTLLPLRIGELLRVDYLARHGDLPRPAVLAVAVTERLLDALILLALFLAALPLVAFDIPTKAALPTLIAILAVAALGLVLAASFPAPFVRLGRGLAGLLGRRVGGWVGDRIEDFVRGFSPLSSPLPVLGAVLSTLGYWLASAGSMSLWILAFDLELPLAAPLVIIGFGAFGTALPSSPGFVGTYDYFTVLALTLLGVERTLATSFALVGHAVGIVPSTLVALALLYPELRRGLSGAGGREDSPASR